MKFLKKVETLPTELEANVLYLDSEGTVTIKKESKPIYEAVDLGLPSGLKWAKCNVGATAETEYGLYFQWASTVGYYKDEQGAKDNSTWATTPYQTVDTTSYSATKFTKYLGSTDSTYKDPTATDADALKTVLDPKDDAATANMSGSWRMPTTEEFQELYANTTCTWVTDFNGSGVNGRKFASKKNDNYIFIPASGYFINGGFSNEGSYGYCWSSSLYTAIPYIAHSLFFSSGYVDPQRTSSRFFGNCVRGVVSE